MNHDSWIMNQVISFLLRSHDLNQVVTYQCTSEIVSWFMDHGAMEQNDRLEDRKKETQSYKTWAQFYKNVPSRKAPTGAIGMAHSLFYKIGLREGHQLWVSWCPSRRVDASPGRHRCLHVLREGTSWRLPGRHIFIKLGPGLPLREKYALLSTLHTRCQNAEHIWGWWRYRSAA